MSKYCTNCGKPLDFGVRYCTYCGYELPAPNIDELDLPGPAKGLLDEPELRRALEMNRSLEQLISRSYGVSWQ